MCLRPQCKLRQSTILLSITECCHSFFFFFSTLIMLPCWMCSDLNLPLTILLTLDNFRIMAVNNSWLLVSCDGWCWHKENMVSNVFLAAPAAAWGSDSDPFGNSKADIAAQWYHIIQSSGWEGRFRCSVCSSCSDVALCTITASSLKPKLLIFHPPRVTDEPSSRQLQISMTHQPMKERILPL